MTHYKHMNLEMNAQTFRNNNEILSCVHPVLKIHYFTVLHGAIQWLSYHYYICHINGNTVYTTSMITHFSSLGRNRTLIKNAIRSLPTALSRALALRAPTALLGICRSWPCATGTPLASAVSGTNWCTYIFKTILGNLHRLKCRISLALKNVRV